LPYSCNLRISKPFASGDSGSAQCPQAVRFQDRIGELTCVGRAPLGRVSQGERHGGEAGGFPPATKGYEIRAEAIEPKVMEPLGEKTGK
jgi:hypothetical protein